MTEKEFTQKSHKWCCNWKTRLKKTGLLYEGVEIINAKNLLKFKIILKYMDFYYEHFWPLTWTLKENLWFISAVNPEVIKWYLNVTSDKKPGHKIERNFSKRQIVRGVEAFKALEWPQVSFPCIDWRKPVWTWSLPFIRVQDIGVNTSKLN